MRKTVRVFAAVGPAERLGRTIAAMPGPVQRTLAEVALRTDLPLVSGSWEDGSGGCLVANAVACVGDAGDRRTLDLRMLDAFPQMSSRDLNTLIVAWDEAAAQARATDEAALRALLRQGLARAGVPLVAPPARAAPLARVTSPARVAPPHATPAPREGAGVDERAPAY
jgi:hypothetical protein